MNWRQVFGVRSLKPFIHGHVLQIKIDIEQLEDNHIRLMVFFRRMVDIIGAKTAREVMELTTRTWFPKYNDVFCFQIRKLSYIPKQTNILNN